MHPITRAPHDLTRRDFVARASALAGATLVPAAAATHARPVDEGPEKGAVVLFQGDSITDASRDRTVSDPNVPRALGDGYPLLVAAAALAAHPDRELRFLNRGVSGNKVPDLEARWATDTIALQPDMLSILVGVNDFWHKLTHGYSGTVDDYENRYVALLEETKRALPDVRLLVLEPFVLRCGAVDDRWFPEFDARRAAAARAARHADAHFVELQERFDDLSRRAPPQYWAADGVHPTPAGHGFIADRWRRAAHL